MATALEQAFITSVAAAASVRQTAIAAALATYGFVQANYAAYLAALVAADVAYGASVNTAATTAGISPDVISPPGAVIGGPWAAILSRVGV